jgi:hypothetical protein
MVMIALQQNIYLKMTRNDVTVFEEKSLKDLAAYFKVRLALN